MNEDLATYLNDHLAGSIAGLDLCERIISLLEGQDGRSDMKKIRDDIKKEQQVLRKLLDEVGASESVIRKAGGWFAEKAAAVKLFLDDPSDGSFRTFEALEALSIGIEGKKLMWRVMEELSESKRNLDVADFKDLINGAKDQRKLVESLRMQFALDALTE